MVQSLFTSAASIAGCSASASSLRRAAADLRFWGWAGD
jgi:hypothetical protein